jgi:hypothetical protein
LPAGSLAAPFTLDQYWTKFEGCAAGLLAPDAAGALRRALADLPHLPTIEPLMTPLGARFPS